MAIRVHEINLRKFLGDKINNSSIVETGNGMKLKRNCSKSFIPRRANRPQKLSDITLNLMTERRLLRLQTFGDAESYRQINRQIQNPCGTVISLILTTLKRRRTTTKKMFARDVSIGQSQLTKLKREDAKKAEVLKEVENLYAQL